MKTLANTRTASPSLISFSNFRPAVLGLVGLLGTTLATPAHAQVAVQKEFPVQVTQADAATLRLRVTNTSATKPIRLEVVNLNSGQWLLNETHRTAAYGTLLKFGGLSTGTYAVVLRMGADRYRYTIKVETKAPSATTIAVRETTTHRVESGLATAAL